MRQYERDKVTLTASVSCFDLYNMERQLPEIEEAGVRFLHFDVVDGRFNNCFILGLPTLQALRPRTNLPIEVHLGVYEPEKFIDQYAKAGADYIGVHYETLRDGKEVFRQIREAGAMPVLCLRAETDYEPAMDGLLREAAFITKLTVNPGYSGQAMQKGTIDQIARLRMALADLGLDIGIQADGNINPETIPAVVASGADILTGGTSGLFLKDKPLKEAAAAIFRAAGL